MTEKRKGALRVADVPSQVLAALQRGELETASLAEWLAIDQVSLAEAVLPGIGLEHLVDSIRSAVGSVKKTTATAVTRIIGQELAREVSVKSGRASRFQKLALHPSDTVRTWAAFVVAHDSTLNFAGRLVAIRPLAADPHFGVREVAWMALRPEVVERIDEAISRLSRWTRETDPSLRRFASEATRPCGVWARHCNALKQEPALGLPILEPLRSDDSKYVRDSVANWLNDASKSAPEWVTQLCHRWERESSTAETRYVIHRALRTLRKQA